MSEKELVRLLRRYKALQREAERVQNEAEAIKAQITAAMCDTDELQAGVYRVTWKAVTSSRLDSKALKAAAPELAERFTRTITTRRFCVA